MVGGAPKLVERMDFDAHIDHAVVGLMDPAHGPYVHQNWWWRSSSHQLEKEKRFEPREQGFAMASHAPSKNSYAYKILGGAPVTEITFRLPGFRWEHITVGPRQVLALTCLTPISETKTRITQVFWSDHWAFTLLAPFVRMASRRFLKQDGDMVNLQNQGLKYDPPLLWIDDADRQAKWYQALKKEWLGSRREGRAFVNPVKGHEPSLEELGPPRHRRELPRRHAQLGQGSDPFAVVVVVEDQLFVGVAGQPHVLAQLLLQLAARPVGEAKRQD